jgi:hypothetical protein
MNNNITEVKIFVGFAIEDNKLKRNFEKHLSPLKSESNIIWCNFNPLNHADENHNLISQKNIEELSSSHMILFLVSPAFISLESFGKYVNASLAARKNRKVIVIPIILDFCNWKITALKDLEPLPKNGFPVADRKWANRNHAFNEITAEIHKRLEEVREIIRKKQEEVENYKKRRFQYQGIVQDIYRQNQNLSDDSKTQLKYHQECLEIQDRDARAIEAEVQEKFIPDEIEENNYYRPTSFKNGPTHPSFSGTEETALGCGCLILLLVAFSIFFNPFNSQNNLLSENRKPVEMTKKISKEEKDDKAKQFPLVFLNAINSRDCQKALKMREKEDSKYQEEFMITCSRMNKVKHRLTNVIFEDNERIKLYVEWEYCQARNLYYVSALWWLQWNTNDQQWLLKDIEPNKNSPQRRESC